jgi:hypothetical protein
MTISRKTRINWLLDAAVFLSAVAAGLSGIYFLYFPSGGFQGGRNPGYGATLLFDRHTWSDVHTWGSIAMILAVAIHLAYHWYWVKSMALKIVKAFRQGTSGLSRGGKVNLIVNLLIGLSFILTAATGMYFLFLPSGGFQGGANPAWDPGFLFSRTTWDLIHTWSGVAMIVAAMFHFVIHWRWIRNVTARFFGSMAEAIQSKQASVLEAQRTQI